MRWVITCIALSAITGCSQQTVKPALNASMTVSAVSFNSSGAPTVEFNAPDMMCAEGCGAKVKEILSEQPGAKEVLVDFDAKKATVAIDADAKFDSNAAVAALVDHGFKNSTVNESAAATESTAKPEVEGDGAIQ